MGYYTDIARKINSASNKKEIKEVFEQVEKQSPSIQKAAEKNRESSKREEEEERKKRTSIPRLIDLNADPVHSQLEALNPRGYKPPLSTAQSPALDLESIARSLGYGTEKTLAGAAGAVEDAFRFASGYGNKLLSGVTSLGGLADNPVSDFLSQTAENTLSGSYVDRWRQSIDERYQPTAFQQKLGGLNEAAGAMLPSIAASFATGGLSNATAIGKGASMTAAGAKAAQDLSRGVGLASMFPQVAGASTRQAMNEGADVDRALTYGALSGALEAGTESLFAGSPGIKGGRVSQAVQNILSKATKSPAVSKAADILGEGVEEVISGYVSPYLQRMTYNEQAELASSDELLESFISGVALSGIMQGGAGIAGRIASRSVGQSLDVNALGENSRKNYIAQMERDGGTTRGFQEQWKQYNDAGNAGIPFAQVPGEPTAIGMSRVYAAHAAGLNDYQARMKKNAPEGTQYKFADHPVPTREQLEQKPDMKVVDIRGRRQGRLSEQRKQFLASKQARRLYEQPVINRDTGEPVFITPATMTHMFSNPGADQIGVAEHIGEIIENAVLTHAEPITHGNQSATGIYTLFGAVQTERGVQPVKIKVKEYDYKGQYLPKTIKDYFIRNGQQDEFASAYDGRVLMLESIEKEDASSSAATMPETSSGVNHPSASSFTVSIAELLGLVNDEGAREYIPAAETSAPRTPGLVQNGYTSSVSENTAKSIDSIAKKAGVTVEIADDVPAAGEYRDGVIRIHANAENPVRQVLVHELTHHLEQSDGYGELVDFYRANTEKSGVRLADLVRAKQEQYAEQGIQLTEDAAQREIIAEFCDTTLFTDERSIMRLAQEKRSLVQKIRDWMHEMRVRLRGTQQEKFILEAEKRYQKALDSVNGQKKNVPGGTQYRIEMTPSGQKITVIDEGQDVFDGKPKSAYASIARRILLDKFKNQVLPLGENDLARLRSKQSGEYAYPRTRYPENSAEYEAKMRAAAELDHLLETAEYSHWAEDKKQHPEATLGFDYYKTRFSVGGHMFEGLLNIANSEKGRILYDMTKVKEIPDASGESATGLAQVGSRIQESPNISISNSEPNINPESQKSQGIRFDELLREAGYTEQADALRRDMTAEERRLKTPDFGWNQAVFAEDSGQNMEIDPDYQRNIDQWDSKGKPDGETFILGSTGDVLQGLGAIESDIYMRGDKIKKILHDHPEMTLHEIKKLPEILEDPVLILKSRNTGRTGKANSRVVVFGNVKAQNGQPVLTVLDLRPYENRFLIEDMQKVNSAYTKDRGAASFFERSDIMYADKKRAAALLRRAGFQMPAGLLRYGSMGSISYENGGVKLHGVPFSEIISIENSESNQFKVNGSSYYDLLRRAGYGEQADALQRASGQYGTINRGEMPARDVQLPAQMDENTCVRRFARTAAESSILTDEQAGEIGKAVAEGRFNYEPIPNDAARAHAENILARGDSYAQDAWDRVVNNNRPASKNDIAVGEYLLKQAAEAGDTQRVVELTAQIAAEGTRAGQIVQAMSMLKRLDGAGQSIALDAMLKKMQGDLDRGKSGVFLKVPDHLREELVKAKGQEQVDKAMDKIYDSLAQQIPTKWSDKWNAWRYLAMLGNPRTHIRNILGNAAFDLVVGPKNAVGSIIESSIYHAQRLAGKKGIDRTKTIRGTIPFTGGKARQFAIDDFSKVQDIIKSGGKMDPSDVIRDKQAVFKFKPLEYLRKMSFNALEAEDGMFLKHNYTRSMVQYLQANKVNLDSFNPDSNTKDAIVLQKARDYAIREAQKATYRDFSRAAQAISQFSRNAGLIPNILMGGISPFVKTPINVLKRGVEYSPAGLLESITIGANKLRKGEIDANEFIDRLSAGITGTAISVLGMLLCKVGLLVGGSGDDKEAEFRDSLGAQSYAIKVGNKSYTIDWLAPVSMPLFVGVEIQQLANTYDGLDGRVVFDSVLNIIEPMTKMSMLDGINTTIKAARYGDDPLSDMAANAVIGYIGQAVPTLFGQIARTLDDTARTTYIEKNGSLPDSVQRALQKNRNKIPGLSNQSIAYRDVFGRAEKDTSMISRALKNFISPGYFSEEKIGSMESELIRVYQNTDDSGVLPSMPAKYFNVNGERKDLTAEEYEKFSYTRGSIMYSNLSELTESSLYKNLDDTDKASAISNVIELSNALAKTEVSDYQLEGWMADAKGAFDKGIKIPDFILIRDGASQIESFKDEEGKTVANSSSVRKAYYLLTETNLTPSQRSYMYEALNVGKKVQEMSPDKVKAEYQKVYDQYGR